MKRLDLAALCTGCWLLTAVIVVGILQAREASRRAQCVSNLHQIGIALHTYHEQHRVLPPSAMGEDVRDLFGLDTGKEVALANWVQLLLPALGETSLANSFNYDVPLSDEKNARARTTRPAAMLCASDGYNIADNAHVRVVPQGKHAEYARGNYALNAGTSMFCYFPGTAERPCPNGFYSSWSPRFQSWGSGVAGFNKSFSFGDFPNGLSRMVATEEIRAGLLPVDSRGVWSLGQIGASYTFAHGIHGDDGGPNYTATKADDIDGCGKLHNIFNAEQLVRARMPCCSYCKQAEQATARSMHVGGVNVLTLDGATHFVIDAVHPNVWHAIHTRDQLEGISDIALN